jgi:hypothetical protein
MSVALEVHAGVVFETGFPWASKTRAMNLQE